MKVLLQDTQTKLFYSSPGHWVKSKEEALNFEKVDRAAQAYEMENYPFAEILVEDDDPNLNAASTRQDQILAHS
jgi:hypothetical protein